MRPTRIELATFGLKDRRSLPLVKAALTTELRAHAGHSNERVDLGSGPMDLGLQGRTALVMGASRGIGRAIAAALAREGARVAIASRSQERLEEAAADDRPPRRPPSSPTPPTSTGSPALPAEVEAELGPIDILVANTGGPPFGGALDHELEEWETAYRSLVLAPKVLADAVVPGMRERGWGRIVNVGSSSTREPIPGLNLSNAHRMAAVGFLKTLAARSPATGSRSTPSPPAASPPSGSPTPAARSTAPKRRRRAKCPPAASATPRSTATSSPSSAPSAPPTSPGP